ncbi:hypothetical protein Taro_039630 [Colocasia esculenta]|uniref:Uncharacterized protein n=1 Tax=Colocasia esculenta TaxID=4460 RepID=A0A843WS31_COLES|nr:hypothetical protein [Colocasia esculenta]
MGCVDTLSQIGPNSSLGRPLVSTLLDPVSTRLDPMSTLLYPVSTPSSDEEPVESDGVGQE